MIGVSLSVTQPSGVVTTFATIIDISWQPHKSANVRIGHFLSSDAYLAGNSPVCTEYFQLDITQIDPTQAIPPQLFSQLTALGAPLNGGTPI